MRGEVVMAAASEPKFSKMGVASTSLAPPHLLPSMWRHISIPAQLPRDANFTPPSLPKYNMVRVKS